MLSDFLDAEGHRVPRDHLPESVLAVHERHRALVHDELVLLLRANAPFLDSRNVPLHANDTMRVHARKRGVDQRARDVFCIGGCASSRHQHLGAHPIEIFWAEVLRRDVLGFPAAVVQRRLESALLRRHQGAAAMVRPWLRSVATAEGS